MPETETPETPETPVYPEDPRDLAQRGGVTRNYYACQSHCCARHGCKYGYYGCPVKTGQVTQDYPCEWCTHAIDEAAFLGDTAGARQGQVGYTIVVAATRAAAEGEDMAHLPSDATVSAKVAEVLTGLDLGHGWTITCIITDTDTDD